MFQSETTCTVVGGCALLCIQDVYAQVNSLLTLYSPLLSQIHVVSDNLNRNLSEDIQTNTNLILKGKSL